MEDPIIYACSSIFAIWTGGATNSPPQSQRGNLSLYVRLWLSLCRFCALTIRTVNLNTVSAALHYHSLVGHSVTNISPPTHTYTDTHHTPHVSNNTHHPPQPIPSHTPRAEPRSDRVYYTLRRRKVRFLLLVSYRHSVYFRWWEAWMGVHRWNRLYTLT